MKNFPGFGLRPRPDAPEVVGAGLDVVGEYPQAVRASGIGEWWHPVDWGRQVERAIKFVIFSSVADLIKTPLPPPGF